MRKYKYYGSDGNGGFIDGITHKEHGSMHEALINEIYKHVHNCLMCEVYYGTIKIKSTK
jgi:ribosomal protein S26